MKIIKSKYYKHTPFSIETQPVENSPGTWNSTSVSIFRDEIFIGEYIRNYPSYGIETFFPFKCGNEWYALYSPHYTTTRVMKLHEDKIEDWCGETGSANGFCPTEFYIPFYAVTIDTIGGSEYTSYDVYRSEGETEFEELITSASFVETSHCNFGFLSGCVWGDDSSWKLRYIDLSKVPDKVLDITEKFGYWEIPSTMTLEECIILDNWGPKDQWIELVKAEHRCLK